ncbi:hypothetical protein V8E54_006741 [Elaphomyces granulatus]
MRRKGQEHCLPHIVAGGWKRPTLMVSSPHILPISSLQVLILIRTNAITKWKYRNRDTGCFSPRNTSSLPSRSFPTPSILSIHPVSSMSGEITSVRQRLIGTSFGLTGQQGDICRTNSQSESTLRAFSCFLFAAARDDVRIGIVGLNVDAIVVLGKSIGESQLTVSGRYFELDSLLPGNDKRLGPSPRYEQKSNPAKVNAPLQETSRQKELCRRALLEPQAPTKCLLPFSTPVYITSAYMSLLMLKKLLELTETSLKTYIQKPQTLKQNKAAVNKAIKEATIERPPPERARPGPSKS